MRNERQEMLANERIGKLLWKMSLPAGIGMFVMTLYNVVDTIFIGHAVGPLGIAGLSIVFPIQILTMGLGMMIGIGGASLISRSLGARDFQGAERTLGNAIFSVFVLGILLAVIGLFNSSFWLRLFGASETILPYAKDYLGVILLGIVFRMFSMSANSLIRAEGNARVPMIAMLIGAILNILLDTVFIMAFGMGIKGAAIATVLSQVVTSLYIIHYYLFQNSSLKVRLKNLVPAYTVTRGIVAIGFGSFVRTAGASLVFLIVNRTLIDYGGDLAVATFGMILRTMMFAYMPVMSVGQGLQPILGFNYGAKRFDRALQVIKLAVIVATIFSIISFLFIFFLPTPIMRIFTTDGSLISAGSHAAGLVFLAAYLIGFQMIGAVVFQAFGKVVPTFLTATSRQILFLLPLVFMLPKFLQLDGIWLSFPISDALSFLLTLALFIHQIRALRSMDLLAKT